MSHGRPCPTLITCSACGGSRPHAANGWCHTCYQRWARHGRPADGPPAPTPLQPCGTDAGYQRHLKLGEPIDDRCRDARNEAQNLRRAKQRATTSTRDQWTAEQASAARTVALATEDSPADRRLLLEALGLAPSTTQPAPAVRAR